MVSYFCQNDVQNWISPIESEGAKRVGNPQQNEREKREKSGLLGFPTFLSNCETVDISCKTSRYLWKTYMRHEKIESKDVTWYKIFTREFPPTPERFWTFEIGFFIIKKFLKTNFNLQIRKAKLLEIQIFKKKHKWWRKNSRALISQIKMKYSSSYEYEKRFSIKHEREKTGISIFYYLTCSLFRQSKKEIIKCGI
jgi:hypothetical protein